MAHPRILIAGIGNIFLGDDAFGIEVLQKLVQRPPLPGVQAIDFGIRGFDLACAMTSGYEAVILVDAVSRGGAPGTLSVIQPDIEELAARGQAEIEGHSLTPARVLQCVHALSGRIPPVYIVGCEPISFGTDENPQMGLSPPIAEAVPRAVELIESLVGEISAGRSA
jgi:hydrogenase maturation protease